MDETTLTQYRSVYRQDLFKDQQLVVTGGGSGIGRCLAHELASLGATVHLIGRDKSKLDAVAAEITQTYDTPIYTYSLDIRDEDAVIETISNLCQQHGQIHGLVNNAGGQFPAPLSEINQKGFETVVRTNLVGGFLISRELYKACFQQHGGAIVNILADMWGGMPMMGHSGAARAGMLNLTQTAALEWAASGVRVNAVAPGWVASSGLDAYTNPAVKKLIPQLKRQVPLKRLATESEISSAICFLLSEAASFINGACLCVDGGASLKTTMFPIPDHNNSDVYQGFPLYQTPEILKDGT